MSTSEQQGLGYCVHVAEKGCLQLRLDSVSGANVFVFGHIILYRMEKTVSGQRPAVVVHPTGARAMPHVHLHASPFLSLHASASVLHKGGAAFVCRAQVPPGNCGSGHYGARPMPCHTIPYHTILEQLEQLERYSHSQRRSFQYQRLRAHTLSLLLQLAFSRTTL